jgi:histidine ammonia-lyase
LRRVVDNVRRILAVELTVSGRAVDLRAPLVPAAGTGAALAALRSDVPGPGPDRFLSPELAAAEELLRSGAVLAAVEESVGPLA